MFTEMMDFISPKERIGKTKWEKIFNKYCYMLDLQHESKAFKILHACVMGFAIITIFLSLGVLKYIKLHYQL